MIGQLKYKQDSERCLEQPLIADYNDTPEIEVENEES